MNGFVLDCSITVAWFFQDEADAYSNGVLDFLKKSVAYVPAFWQLEVANAFLMAEKKKRVSQANLVQAIAEIKLLPIEIAQDEPDAIGLINLARRYNLSIYDATYLDLAMQFRMPLASKDNGLNAAAKKCGIHRLELA